MRPIRHLITLFAACAASLAAASLAAAQTPPRVVLFEDPGLSAQRLHYPLLIAGDRGYRILCTSQAEEEAVIRGLGFATVPSQILTAIDPDVVAARPGDNPALCPDAPDYDIKVFAAEGAQGLTHYLQFPADRGASSYSDRIYVPACVGLIDALGLDLSTALNADPTPFFQGKIHTIECLNGVPPVVEPTTFAAWCMKGDRSEAETASVMAMLDATPGGISALGSSAACTAADQFLRAIPSLNLTGKGVVSTAPLAVLTHLTSLTLADNAIVDIAPLSKLSALTFLDLSGNRLTNISALAPLTALTRLDLSRNSLTDVRALSALALLNVLALDDNEIADLGPLQFLQALSTLSLAGNGLTGDQIEPLTALGGLAELDLSDNQIETFANLGEFPSTLDIDLTGNPITASDVQTFLDLCILNRDAPTPFGQTVRAILALAPEGTCAAANDAVLASTTLDLSAKIISDLRPLAGLTHLTTLKLADNGIGDLAPLSGLVELRNLDLTNNEITDIRPLGPLTKIQTLTATGNPVAVEDFLSGCLMRNQTGALSAAQTAEIAALLAISLQQTCLDAGKALAQLQSADLRNRGLTSLQYADAMSGLVAIDVSQNALTSVAGLEEIPGLIRLTIRDNAIPSINAFFDLERLESLVIDGNPIVSLGGIGRLQRLQRLNISNTGISNIQILNDLPALETATMRNLSLNFPTFLDYCLVHRLDPVALGQERSFMLAIESRLQADNIDDSDCNAVDQWARELTSLSLNKKAISSVAPVAHMSNLQELNLFDNDITNVRAVATLRGLKKLNLSKNKLRDLPVFGSVGMTSLYLEENSIHDLRPLSNLSVLNYLDVSKNGLVDTTPLLSMGQLATIDLRNNAISDFFMVWQMLPKLFLGDNPLCGDGFFGSSDEVLTACAREPLNVFWPGIAILDGIAIQDRVRIEDLTVCPPNCTILQPNITIRPTTFENLR